MKRFSFFASSVLILGAVLLSLNACQKETLREKASEYASVTERSPSGNIYGVTVYNGVNPCNLVTIDQGTGAVTNTVVPYVLDSYGNHMDIENLKGVCINNQGRVFITSGNPFNALLGPGLIAFNNALFQVNPVTGLSTYVSTSLIGTVSDLEFDPQTGDFYGLQGNSNAIIQIAGGTVYNGPFAINGIAKGYTLKGLSLVRDGGVIYLVGCATSANPAEPAKLYTIPAGGGTAVFMTDLDTVGDLGAGHCGIGFDLNLNNMLVNRNITNAVSNGLNRFNWTPPFGPVTTTSFWGAAPHNFEDLSSSVY
ncbi:MAG: hypothetical protein H7246_13220 [Phycisphaerae bacterium]|nr:hypothetical protein [Saprospiraceae bacterium]